MNLRPALVLTALLGLAGVAAQAQTRAPASTEPAPAAITAEGGWTRPTVPGQPAAGGYLVVRNTGSMPDRIVAATSPAAGRVELHSMSMDGDVMRMREIDGIALPAGQTVELKPGGLHLMIFGVKSPLKPGDSLPVVLKLEKGGELRTSLSVGAAAPAGSGGHGGHGEHKH